uniref:Chromosome 20 open reading frame 85 n=1 Tax=Malurus cyaneus samueli TaxID=2593467 RepID=A0A8C5TTM9_9PASS
NLKYFSVGFRKRHIESERDAAKRWADKWGFLKTPLEEVKLNEEKKVAKPKIELPDHLRVRPVTPVEKYIKVLPSPPVPKTTQGFIGWRSGIPELGLEHDYQIQSCKGTSALSPWPSQQ